MLRMLRLRREWTPGRPGPHASASASSAGTSLSRSSHRQVIPVLLHKRACSKLSRSSSRRVVKSPDVPPPPVPKASWTAARSATKLCGQAALRAARVAAGARAGSSAGPVEEPVGAATETHAEHRRRHPALVPGCSRCVYTQLRGSLCSTYGSHRHEVAGKVVKTVWLSERPAKLGGRWGIGCVFCATLAEKRPRRKRRLSGVVRQATTGQVWSTWGTRFMGALRGLRLVPDGISWDTPTCRDSHPPAGSTLLLLD